jgi:hypothetical protein
MFHLLLSLFRWRSKEKDREQQPEKPPREKWAVEKTFEERREARRKRKPGPEPDER